MTDWERRAIAIGMMTEALGQGGVIARKFATLDEVNDVVIGFGLLCAALVGRCAELEGLDPEELLQQIALEEAP